MSSPGFPPTDTERAVLSQELDLRCRPAMPDETLKLVEAEGEREDAKPSDVCHCGEEAKRHTLFDNHGFVSMGTHSDEFGPSLHTLAAVEIRRLRLRERDLQAALDLWERGGIIRYMEADVRRQERARAADLVRSMFVGSTSEVARLERLVERVNAPVEAQVRTVDDDRRKERARCVEQALSAALVSEDPSFQAGVGAAVQRIKDLEET